MSKTNGSSESWRERLDRVEASHVKLMTDFEVWTREHEREHQRIAAEREADRAEWKERSAAADARMQALGTRIEALVSAMGAFIAKREGGAQ